MNDDRRIARRRISDGAEEAVACCCAVFPDSRIVGAMMCDRQRRRTNRVMTMIIDMARLDIASLQKVYDGR